MHTRLEQFSDQHVISDAIMSSDTTERGYCQWYQHNSFRQSPPKRPGWETGYCCRRCVQPDVRADRHRSKRLHYEAAALSGTLTMNVFTFTTPVMQPVIAAFEKLNPGVTSRRPTSSIRPAPMSPCSKPNGSPVTSP